MALNVSEYYRRSEVRKEIVEYCRNRWVAVHCEEKMKDDRPILLRYYKYKPLTLSKLEDVDFILSRYSKLKPRTFYATSSVYKRILTRDDVLDYFGNVLKRTPSWDIDSRVEWWRTTLKIAKALVKILEDNGVRESIYLKWSGRGLHVHINENAISSELYSKVPPLDLTYSIVEYVTIKVQKSLNEINASEGTSIKVENLMDPQRVFTAPLSLHRFLNVVCVVFKPDELEDFDISWTKPSNYRHSVKWREYKEGEADNLALKAIEAIGGYPKMIPQRKKRKFQLEKRIQKYLPKNEEAIGPKLVRFKLVNLRLNLNPPPISGGRNFSKGPSEAFLKIEDVLSHYALGHVNLEHAIKALRYALYAILPSQNYREEDLSELKNAYRQAIRKLEELRTPEKVREWLLSHGTPKIVKKLDEFF